MVVKLSKVMGEEALGSPPPGYAVDGEGLSEAVALELRLG